MERRHMDMSMESYYKYKPVKPVRKKYFERLYMSIFVCRKDFGPGGSVLEDTKIFSDHIKMIRGKLRLWLNINCPPVLLVSDLRDDNEWRQVKDIICTYDELIPGPYIEGERLGIPCIEVWFYLERWRRNGGNEAVIMEIEGYRPVPAAKGVIEALEKVRLVQDEESCCPICLENLEVGSQVARLRCTHLFHGDCIVKWLSKKNFCPLCRLWV